MEQKDDYEQADNMDREKAEPAPAKKISNKDVQLGVYKKGKDITNIYTILHLFDLSRECLCL